MGSILEALYAGCRLASTETMITISEAVTTSIGAIVGARMRPVAWPKLKVIFERFNSEDDSQAENNTHDGAGQSQAKAFD